MPAKKAPAAPSAAGAPNRTLNKIQTHFESSR